MMVTVTLAASLTTYLTGGNGGGSAPTAYRSVTLAADTWPDTVAELRSRFGQLGDRLFEESGRLRTGFLVAVNDEVSRRPDGPSVGPGDHVYLFAQIAGG